MAVDYNNILMIYIPRNGCASLVLHKVNGVGENRTINAAREYPLMANGRFDALLELKSKIDVSQYNKITIARNPYTRAYSLYRKYLTLVSLSKQDLIFNEFLTKIKNNGTFHSLARGLVNKTQSWFIQNESNQIDSSVRVYKLENLSEMQSELELPSLTHSYRQLFNSDEEILSHFGPDAENPLARKRKFYSASERQQAYTKQCIDLVQEIYSQDFDNFNYSRNIDDII